MAFSRPVVAALALLALAACGDSGSGPKASAPARIDVTVAPTASVAVGATPGKFTVKVVDASGGGVSGTTVSFTTTGGAVVAPATAVSASDGSASTTVTIGTVAGPATVRASVTGVTTAASASFTVTAGPLVSLSITPKTARLNLVGDTLRLLASSQDQYGNAASATSLTWTVVDQTLLSVDATGLVRVLRKGGTTQVIATGAGKADTSTIAVLAVGESICGSSATPTALAVGGMLTISGAQFGCLSAGASSGEFAVVAFNNSRNGDQALQTTILGQGLGAAPTGFSSLVAAGDVALRSVSGVPAVASAVPDESFHLKLLADYKRDFAGRRAARQSARSSAASRSISTLPSGSSRSTSSFSAVGQIPSTAKVGDYLTLNVSANFCSRPVNHALRVAAIGTKSIVLSDTLNPADGFTDAEYQRFATRFDTLVYPLDVGAFGDAGDIDGNGRVAIIFTRTVNELTPVGADYFVGGFFNPRDLEPRVGPSVDLNCAGSNEGEMFYMLVPTDSVGINGVKHTKGFVDSLTTGTIAHEFQHLINESHRLYVESEEVWLNEGLSHIAEELLYYRESGKGPRQNLNDNAIRVVDRPGYVFWKMDASQNFSRLLSYITSPGANSPIADDDELATRGATWSFLRYLADHVGTNDGTIWQQLVNSGTTGFGTLTKVLGADPMPMIRDWAVANYVDDLGITSDARFQNPSWNFRDIYSTTFLAFKAYPLRVTNIPDNTPVSLSIRGGSASYARFTVSAGGDALLSFTSGGGAPLSAFQFIVVRTK